MTPSVSSLLVMPLAHALGSCPGALDAFFRATGLSPEQLGDVDARISPSQFCAAWAEASHLSGDPSFSLRVAAVIPEGALGVVEYVCRTAPTIGVALGHWIRYLRLLNSSVEVALVEEGHEAFVRVSSDSETPAPGAHELCFGVLVARVRALAAAPVSVVRVDFTHASEHTREFERWFGAPVRFGARRTQLVLARDALHVALRTADPNLHRIVRTVAEERAGDWTDTSTFTSRASRFVRESLRANEANIDDVARKLGLTGRSLQRRLKDEGTSFQEVREAVRQKLAQEHLDDGLSIAEIAFLLGFSEPSAFFRAFKRWTGLTPLESRERRRAELSAS